MDALRLCVISLRYSSWSMRPWLALTHAGATFETETAQLSLGRKAALGDGPADRTEPAEQAAALSRAAQELSERRRKGSVTGLYPVLYIGAAPIHESLAICEWVAETYPEAGLMPEDTLSRARVRAISSEMASGFGNLRSHLSCHLFGRVPGFSPDAATRVEIARLFELWQDALERSGGPFLFGRFGIADAMYFPVRTRFRTYGIAIPDALTPYVQALDALPAVQALHAFARSAPAIVAYDDYLRSLGGDPAAAR